MPDGTPGELVFTTVTKEALPLLRYRTGDIAALRRGTCPCGRTLVKMSKITGRRDDMLVIRGVNVYPSEVERVLLATPPWPLITCWWWMSAGPRCASSRVVNT